MLSVNIGIRYTVFHTFLNILILFYISILSDCLLIYLKFVVVKILKVWIQFKLGFKFVKIGTKIRSYNILQRYKNEGCGCLYLSGYYARTIYVLPTLLVNSYT